MLLVRSKAPAISLKFATFGFRSMYLSTIVRCRKMTNVFSTRGSILLRLASVSASANEGTNVSQRALHLAVCQVPRAVLCGVHGCNPRYLHRQNRPLGIFRVSRSRFRGMLSRLEYRSKRVCCRRSIGHPGSGLIDTRGRPPSLCLGRKRGMGRTKAGRHQCRVRNPIRPFV